MGRYLEMARRVIMEQTMGGEDQEHLSAPRDGGEQAPERGHLNVQSPATSFSNEQLIERIAQGRWQTANLKRQGKPVSDKRLSTLQELEEELAHRMPEAPLLTVRPGK